MIMGRTLYLLALQKTADRFAFSVCRPNTGPSFFDFEVRTPYSVADESCQRRLCALGEVTTDVVREIACQQLHGGSFSAPRDATAIAVSG